MKVALIGASGFIGSCILAEALRRGHHVTGIVRHPEKITTQDEKLTVVAADATHPDELAKIVAGHEAVISAYNLEPDPEIPGYKAIIAGVQQAGVPRLLVVGGAGTVEIAPGVQLVDTPDFPEAWKPGALAMRNVYEYLQTISNLDWTFFAPAMMIQPGERTGQFRTSAQGHLFDANGESKISSPDYAIAMVDELEKPQHLRQLFTVGY